MCDEIIKQLLVFFPLSNMISYMAKYFTHWAILDSEKNPITAFKFVSYDNIKSLMLHVQPFKPHISTIWLVYSNKI